MGLLLACLALGVATGVTSGLFGIGGGVVMVPGLVLLLAFDQKTATGTSLAALLPPVVGLSVLAYARAGHVRWPAAFALSAGLVVGGLVGARIALAAPDRLLRGLFALLLVGLAVRLVTAS